MKIAFDNSNEDVKQSNEDTTSFSYINIDNRFSPLKKAKRSTVKKQQNYKNNDQNNKLEITGESDDINM